MGMLTTRGGRCMRRGLGWAAGVGVPMGEMSPPHAGGSSSAGCSEFTTNQMFYVTHTEQEPWQELCGSPCGSPQPRTRLNFGPLCRGTPAPTNVSSKSQETTHRRALFQFVVPGWGGDRNSAIAVAPAPGRVSEGHGGDQPVPRATLQAAAEGQPGEEHSALKHLAMLSLHVLAAAGCRAAPGAHPAAFPGICSLSLLSAASSALGQGGRNRAGRGEPALTLPALPSPPAWEHSPLHPLCPQHGGQPLGRCPCSSPQGQRRWPPRPKPSCHLLPQD